MEVHIDGKWQAFDPTFGNQFALPPGYLPVSKGNVEPVTLTEGKLDKLSYLVENIDPLMDLPDACERGRANVFDLSRLSLDTRLLLATLFLMPLAVLLTAMFIELIGVSAFGVFTPTFLAASLVHVPGEVAATIITTVLVFGVGWRLLMPDRLKRTLRRPIVITYVSVGVGISASLLEYFDLLYGGQMALLPVVVLVTLVDRFYTLVDKRGVRTAVYRLIWTLVIALVCLPIVHFDALGHALISHPYWHLFTLAGMLAISFYQGKRLAQVKGLAWIAWAERAKSG